MYFIDLKLGNGADEAPKTIQKINYIRITAITGDIQVKLHTNSQFRRGNN